MITSGKERRVVKYIVAVLSALLAAFASAVTAFTVANKREYCTVDMARVDKLRRM